MAIRYPNVRFERREIKNYRRHYRLIDDVLGGSIQVKKKGSLYLPMPDAEDQSKENKARFAAYAERAVFYPVARRTLMGLLGEVFARDPVIELLPGLEVLQDDADGGGLSLTQMAKAGTKAGLAKGRSGLFVDYPNTGGGASREQIDSGIVRPTLSLIQSQDIINWRKERIGAKMYLTLVVFRFDELVYDDGYETKLRDAWRSLRLVDGVYQSQIWRSSGAGNLVLSPDAAVEPTDAAGNKFSEIPFEFIGSEDNDADPDYPPMFDICDMNIAHYRNSADHEESSFIVGQPTPVISGVDEHWYTEVLKGKLRFGSRGGIALPQGGTGELLQAATNTMPKEGMDHKEAQMVALGAKLVEQRQVQRTAFETGVDSASDNSILASVANNANDAFRQALKWAAAFSGDDPASIKFDMNKEFHLTRLSAQEQQQLIKTWQDDAISFSEMRAQLRKSNIATLDDEAARTEIDADFDRQLKQASLMMETQQQQSSGQNEPTEGN